MKTSQNYRCVGAVAAWRERAKESKRSAKARAVGSTPRGVAQRNRAEILSYS